VRADVEDAEELPKNSSWSRKCSIDLDEYGGGRRDGEAGRARLGGLLGAADDENEGRAEGGECWGMSMSSSTSGARGEEEKQEGGKRRGEVSNRLKESRESKSGGL
jgi:hypothetical protein